MRQLKWRVRGLLQRALPRLTFAVLANRTWVHEPEVQLLPLLAASKALAIDVGANKGVYLYHLCRHFARVVAFEPLPQMSAFLTAAAPANATVHRVALSRDEGSGELALPKGMNELGSVEAAAGVGDGGIEMERHPTLLKPLDSYGFAAVGLIKIDVEGHEHAVIDGARATILRSHPTILVEVEERHRAGGVEALRRSLEKLGYEGYFLDRAALRPIGEFDLARDQSPAAIASSVKVGRYINNFIYFERRQAAERVARINRWLAMPAPQRAAAIAAEGSLGLEPAWHRLVAPGSLFARRAMTSRSRPAEV